MRTYLECIPCFLRQSLDGAKLVSTDRGLQEKVLREVLERASKMDLSDNPPAMAQYIHRLIRQHVNNDDPYRQIKQKYNQWALELYPYLKERINVSDEPLGVALRLALAGNIIDFGANGGLTADQAQVTIEQALSVPLPGGALEHFTRATGQAQRILYIGDNAGEIVFDRLLLEELPREKITFAVRGGPVINDVTREDAQMTGITEIVEVIDTGSDAPGVILESSSETFKRCFEQSEIIISKGQGNFESLNEVPKRAIFLLKAKCPVIADHLQCRIGDWILQIENQLYIQEVNAG